VVAKTLTDGLDGLLEQSALGEASFEHSAKGAPSNDRRYTVIRVGHWRARSDVGSARHAGGGGKEACTCGSCMGAMHEFGSGSGFGIGFKESVLFIGT
jgi:hypothetical protein